MRFADGHRAVMCGGIRDHPIVKTGEFGDLFAKPMSVGIVRIVVVVISKISGTFLQSRHVARAS